MKTTCLDGLWQEGRDFLGVRYPILCGAMTWISDSTLVKAVGAQGGFGCLAAGNMPGEVLADEIRRCAEGSDKPFAVNLVTIAPNFPAHKEAVLQSKAPVVIFAGNFPKRNDVAQMKAAGKKVLSFASTDSIADQMVRFGVDGADSRGQRGGRAHRACLADDPAAAGALPEAGRAGLCGGRGGHGADDRPPAADGRGRRPDGHALCDERGMQRAPEPEGALCPGAGARSDEHAGIRQAPADRGRCAPSRTRRPRNSAACSWN
jgi:hypothetical protein